MKYCKSIFSAGRRCPLRRPVGRLIYAPGCPCPAALVPKLQTDSARQSLLPVAGFPPNQTPLSMAPRQTFRMHAYGTARPLPTASRRTKLIETNPGAVTGTVPTARSAAEGGNRHLSVNDQTAPRP